MFSGALIAAAAVGLLADLRRDRRPPELARGRQPVRTGQREPLAVDRDDVDRRQQRTPSSTRPAG